MDIRKYHGIVEGFFSDPLPAWTHQERLTTLRFIVENCPRINTYVYAPKNDQWVTQRPFDLYPEKKIRELRETVARCQRQKITFVYGLNPTFIAEQINQNFEAYIRAISKKISQLHSVGVRNFCILYDEIPFALNFDEAKITSQKDTAIGKMHARILNALRERLSGTIEALWFCPPDYSFTRATPYLGALLKNLDISIPIVWTGDGIFTQKISSALLKKGRSVVGPERDIIYWDNYPVNDCPHPVGTFHIGAFNAPSPEAHAELKGILVNPMRECFANFIVYLTLEHYLRSPRLYDRSKAFSRACRLLLGADWQRYKSLYETFSAKNIVDDAPRGYYKRLLKKKASLAGIVTALGKEMKAVARPRLVEGRLFVETTSAVLKRARNMHELFSRILAKRNWEKYFLAHDSFPVTLNKKYLTRQFTVLVKRLAVADAYSGKKSPLITAITQMLSSNNFSTPHEKAQTELEKNLIGLLGIFVKYQHKNRLSITPKDTKKLSEILTALIGLEQRLFIEKTHSLSAAKKIQALVARSQINFY